MRLIAPDGYQHFACIADRCRHTCCAHWEIDIDEDTLARYRQLPGALGEELRASIAEEDGAAHFVLGAGERCPMLDERGLCRLILAGGEALLCQVCTDHPRFRSTLTDRVEIGLGLCCEEAVRQLLDRKEPFRLITLEDDGRREEQPEDEAWLLAFREQLLDILRERALPLEERLDRVLDAADMPVDERTPAEWAELLAQLEQLDPAWGELLTLLAQAPEIPALPEAMDLPSEQLACMLVFRQLPEALYDELPEARAALCVMMTRLARRITALRIARGEDAAEAMRDTVRLMSSELEYSDVNIGELLDIIEGTE